MTKRIYTKEQKQRNLEIQLARRRANPEKYREMGRKSEHRRRLKRYGLTEDDWDYLMKIQNSRCAICNVILQKGRHCHVDHCHTSGKVRGLLCSHCNLMLGHARDNVELLAKAITYLKESSIEAPRDP